MSAGLDVGWRLLPGADDQHAVFGFGDGMMELTTFADGTCDWGGAVFDLDVVDPRSIDVDWLERTIHSVIGLIGEYWRRHPESGWNDS